jgi:hypothetical protein
MNWARVNRALGLRGEVTLWIDEAVLSGSRASGGKGKRYSDPVRAQPSRGVQDATAPDPGCPRQLQEIARGHDPDPTLFDPCALGRRAGRAADFARLGHWPTASGHRPPLIGLGGRKVFGEGAWKTKRHGKDKCRVWVPRCIWRQIR